MEKLSVAGLFSGIGGFEEGFRLSGHEIRLLCEIDPAAKAVLKKRFRTVPIETDIRELKSLPPVDVLAAGFPCQDLSPAGRMAGIDGTESGLVSEIFRLLKSSSPPPKWLIMENVPFMLQLQQGRAIRTLTDQLASDGWMWAYRIIDARAFGIPQRRRRVILVASRSEDPRPVLLNHGSEAILGLEKVYAPCGFYWTEGNRGLGWAHDAIPPLKGSSNIGIPSPPAIWIPKSRKIVVPSIQDAERLQGFRANWTKPAETAHLGDRARWRLVGNALPIPMAEWLGRQLINVSPYKIAFKQIPFSNGSAWPKAAWGTKDKRYRVDLSEYPVCEPYQSLNKFLRYPCKPLSFRAARGFLSRLEASSLRVDERFLQDLRQWVANGK